MCTHSKISDVAESKRCRDHCYNNQTHNDKYMSCQMSDKYHGYKGYVRMDLHLKQRMFGVKGNSQLLVHLRKKK